MITLRPHRIVLVCDGKSNESTKWHAIGKYKAYIFIHFILQLDFYVYYINILNNRENDF